MCAAIVDARTHQSKYVECSAFGMQFEGLCTLFSAAAAAARDDFVACSATLCGLIRSRQCVHAVQHWFPFGILLIAVFAGFSHNPLSAFDAEHGPELCPRIDIECHKINAVTQKGLSRDGR